VAGAGIVPATGARLRRPVLLAALLLSAPAAAQNPAAIEREIALEFIRLELAGWRLPNPDESCLAALKLKRLEAAPYGAVEMIEDPILVDGDGPFVRGLALAADPADARRRIVRFEWTVPGPQGTRNLRDSFSFAINDLGAAEGAASMLREPQRLVVRRACFPG
jgi:hypothetical protein